MAGDDEEVVVHIEDEQLAADLGLEVTKEVKAEPAKKTGADDPVADLKSQFATLQTTAAASEREKAEALRRERDANQRAEQAFRERDEAKGQVVGSQYDTVVAGISAADTEATAAEAEYASAFEKGDGPGMATAQRKMARAESRKTRLEEAKADLETTQESQKAAREAAPEKPDRRPPADPVDAYIENRTEPTKAWLREHRDFITDPKKNAKLTAAHYNAVGEGLSPDTQEYFDHVEGFIGLNDAGKTSAKTTTPQRRQGAPTVPVSYTGGGTNGGGQEVRLTAGEARAATDGTHVWNYDDSSGKGRFKKGDPIGVQEFGKRKLAMQKEGRYDKSYVES